MIKEFDLNGLGFLPEDKNILDFNMRGNPLIDLPDDSRSVAAMRDILIKLQLL